MKVLVVNEYDSVIGGAEQYLRSVLPKLLAFFEIAFFGRVKRSDKTQSSDILTDKAIYSIDTLERAIAWKPDLILDHGISPVDCKKALLKAAPNHLFCHNHVGTCISGFRSHQFPRPTPCMKKFGLGCLFHYLPRRCGGRNPIEMVRLHRLNQDYRNLLSQYRSLIVFSSAMHRIYENHGVESKNLQHLRFFPPEIDAGEEPTTHPISGNLLFLGRLTKIKGASYLIRSVELAQKQLSIPLSLTIAGAGQELESLQMQASNSKIPIHFPGWVSGVEKQQLIKKHDLILVPSLWSEPFGLIGVEAAACGVPSVATDMGGISDWCISGETGELVPSNPISPNEIAKRIIKILSDPAYWHHLRIGAWKFARMCSIDDHVSSLVSHIMSHEP
jgi:glycosyltransferase involved in cell wall biosynthesis